MSFDRIVDLAATYRIPPHQLETSLAHYNKMDREGGQDEFGKPFSHGVKPLVRSPFYAIRLWPKVHYTSGGVGINSNCEVFDTHNHPIPHLFAAGEICGGIHGASRLPSCALPECIVFGRIAGKSAASLHSQI